MSDRIRCVCCDAQSHADGAKLACRACFERATARIGELELEVKRLKANERARWESAGKAFGLTPPASVPGGDQSGPADRRS